MGNLTAHYKVLTVGLKEEIDAVSLQDAARQMLERHGFTSVRSVAVTYDAPDGGTVEYVDCENVNGRFEYRAAYILDVKTEDYEARERLEALALYNVWYFTNSTTLEIGTTIRRYDEIAQDWYEGTVGQISSWNFEKQARTYSLALVVPGYAPSPLQEGQLIEIVTEAEETATS